jgi:hypothetical protein
VCPPVPAEAFGAFAVPQFLDGGFPDIPEGIVNEVYTEIGRTVWLDIDQFLDIETVWVTNQ